LNNIFSKFNNAALSFLSK